MGSKYVLIKDIVVQNANAMSSYLTIGVPAVSAIAGFIHALQRKLNADDINIKLAKFAMLYSDLNIRAYKANKYDKSCIVNSANPSVLSSDSDKEITRPAFIAEAKCHFKLNLIVEITTAIEDYDSLIEKINHHLQAGLKLAGGDILSHKNLTAESIYNIDDDQAFNQLKRKLFGSFALIERRDLIIEATKSGENPLDALIANLAVHHQAEQIFNDQGEVTNVTWESKKLNSGWLVPIATGFQGISDLGYAENQRDATTPHRFAESLITLGEFKMPHHFTSINQLLWCCNYNSTNNIYAYIQTANAVTSN